MSTIKGDVRELVSINERLAQLNIERKAVASKIKALKESSNRVQTRIQDYIRQKELPGIKYQGLVITLKPKLVRAPKKKKDRDADALAILRETMSEGDAEKAYKRLMEARRGAPLENSEIRVEHMK